MIINNFNNNQAIQQVPILARRILKIALPVCALAFAIWAVVDTYNNIQERRATTEMLLKALESLNQPKVSEEAVKVVANRLQYLQTNVTFDWLSRSVSSVAL